MSKRESPADFRDGEFGYHANLGFFNRVNYALSERVRRKVFHLFMRECGPTPESLVGDLGVTANQGHPVHYFFEALYPWKNKLTAVGREEAYWYPERFPGMTYINADLRSIPLPDGYFDAAICVRGDVGKVQRRFLIRGQRLNGCRLGNAACTACKRDSKCCYIKNMKRLH